MRRKSLQTDPRTISDPNAEAAIIGIIMLNDGADMVRVHDKLRPEDFACEDSRDAYITMLQLWERQAPINVSTVMTEMNLNGLWKTSSLMYLSNAVDAIGSSASLEFYVDTVRQLSHSRELYRLVLKWAGKIITKPADRSHAELIARDLRTIKGAGDSSKTFSDLKGAYEEWLSAGDKVYLQTHLEKLDDYVKCQQDYLWVIGARPKTGKTSFVVDLLSRFAATNQGGGLFYSLEMGADRIMRKFAARLVPHEAYRRRVSGQDGLLTVSELLREHAEKLYEMPIKVIDDQHTIEDIVASARSEIARDPSIRYIAIDYVELIGTREKLNGSVEIINHALRTLVALKAELGRPVFLISQLRRRGEDFSSEPSMDELKGSGLIEQSADVIILLWEGTMNQHERDRAGTCYRKINAKLVQRDGPHGVLEFAYYPQQSRFTTWTFRE